MKIRRIKRNLWSRRFVSNGHHPFMTPTQNEAEWRALCRSKFVPRIHGLAFNDARSQGRRRHVPHGRCALLELPVDPMHMDRKSYKAIDREQRAGDRKTVKAAWKIRKRLKQDSAYRTWFKNFANSRQAAVKLFDAL